MSNQKKHLSGLQVAFFSIIAVLIFVFFFKYFDTNRPSTEIKIEENIDSQSPLINVDIIESEINADTIEPDAIPEEK